MPCNYDVSVQLMNGDGVCTKWNNEMWFGVYSHYDTANKLHVIKNLHGVESGSWGGTGTAAFPRNFFGKVEEVKKGGRRKTRRGKKTRKTRRSFRRNF